MISRNLYINIIVRVVAITLFAIGTAWLLMSREPVAFVTLGFLAVLAITVNLINYLNSTNRRLSNFFEAVKNEDSTLSFPVISNSKTIRELDDSMNKINNQIRQLRIESRQQEQYFQELLEHVATGIITFNKAGFILHANTAAKKMFSVDILTHLGQLERVNRKVFRTIQNIKPYEHQLVTVSSERETVQLSLKASSFKMGTEELTILSIQDIRNELDEKELDSWMKLIRVMMHEIINSIAPITSLSESLGRLYTENGVPVKTEKISDMTIQTTLQGLSVIRNQGNGLLSFIESYRRLTRLPKPEKKSIRCEDLLSSLAILYPSFENSLNAELSISCNPSDLEIFADETQITLCIINLLKNALQANANTIDATIHVEACIKNGRPEIRVVDNGPGIQPEIIEEIFVPFFTTRDEGSGIGLSISRQIMRLHGGSLRVTSVPGKETAFCLNF